MPELLAAWEQLMKIELKQNADDHYECMSEEKLMRKQNQAWEMAGLARQDGDKADAKRHTVIAMAITEELRRRKS
jgi:hypothetical protein